MASQVMPEITERAERLRLLTISVGRTLPRHPLLEQREFNHSSSHYTDEEGLVVEVIPTTARERAVFCSCVPSLLLVEHCRPRPPPLVAVLCA